jgi:hypothetical protein
MQAILRRLLDLLDAIAEQHGEVGDTAVREAMSEAVFDGFLRPVSAFALPDRYAMFSEEGDLLVKRALAEFLPAANHSAAEAGSQPFMSGSPPYRTVMFDRPVAATSMTTSVGRTRRTTTRRVP